MIPALLHITIVLAFLSDFELLRQAMGPAARVMPLLPELASAALLAATLLEFSNKKKVALSPKYLMLGILIITTLIIGHIINGGSSGTLVSGIRDYLRYIPLFLVPAVYQFSEAQMKRIFKVVLFFGLLQGPVSIYQWVFIMPTITSADVVRGTLSAGSLVSTMNICMIAALICFWLKGHLQLRWLLVLGALLLLPTMINETKATILLFIVAVLAIGYFSAKGTKALLGLLGGGVASVFFVIIFSFAYDFFFPESFGDMTFIEFYTDKAINQEYKQLDSPEQVGEVPRIDSLVFAYRKLSEDPMWMVFGLGIANVAHPDRGDVLGGKYSEYYEYYDISRTTYTQALWEIGFLGIFILALITFCVFRDGRKLSEEKGFWGVFGLSWAVIMVILPLALLYKTLIHASALVVMLMFFSGLVAARRFLMVPENKTIASPFVQAPISQQSLINR